MYSLTHISPLTRTKWAIFRALEGLSEISSGRPPLTAAVPESPAHEPSLWLFASTIGELNAIDPFIRALRTELPTMPLVLISDHGHYRDSYLTRYPDASFVVSHGTSREARRLAKRHPPALLLLAEIPCKLSDAPCRFSFAFLREAKRANAPVCAINGWLYRYQPACRLDDIENRLLQRDYIRLFDLLSVQTEDIRSELIAQGAAPERVTVTGNIKFDAVTDTHWSPQQARKSPKILEALHTSKRPVIVAGCVTNLAEQKTILDAFQIVLHKYPDALLVLAPRHPEVVERMQALADFFRERGLNACFRSKIDDLPLAPATQCLALDTLGELRDFYAAATITHVGINHNVLEPLTFNKPATVCSGWEPTQPSYPVYSMLHQQNAIYEHNDASLLADCWIKLLDTQETMLAHLAKVKRTLETARGATLRNMALMHPIIDLIRSRFPTQTTHEAP